MWVKSGVQCIPPVLLHPVRPFLVLFPGATPSPFPVLLDEYLGRTRPPTHKMCLCLHTGAASIKSAFFLSAQLQRDEAASATGPLVLSSTAVEVPAGSPMVVPVHLQPPWYAAGMASPWRALALRLRSAHPRRESVARGEPGKQHQSKRVSVVGGEPGKLHQSRRVCLPPLVAIPPQRPPSTDGGGGGVEHTWANLTDVGLAACDAVASSEGCSVLLLLDPACGHTLSLSLDIALAFPQLLLGRMALLVAAVQAALLFALANSLMCPAGRRDTSVIGAVVGSLPTSPWAAWAALYLAAACAIQLSRSTWSSLPPAGLLGTWTLGDGARAWTEGVAQLLPSCSTEAVHLAALYLLAPSAGRGGGGGLRVLEHSLAAALVLAAVLAGPERGSTAVPMEETRALLAADGVTVWGTLLLASAAVGLIAALHAVLSMLGIALSFTWTVVSYLPLRALRCMVIRGPQTQQQQQRMEDASSNGHFSPAWSSLGGGAVIALSLSRLHPVLAASLAVLLLFAVAYVGRSPSTPIRDQAQLWLLLFASGVAVTLPSWAAWMQLHPAEVSMEGVSTPLGMVKLLLMPPLWDSAADGVGWRSWRGLCEGLVALAPTLGCLSVIWAVKSGHKVGHGPPSALVATLAGAVARAGFCLAALGLDLSSQRMLMAGAAVISSTEWAVFAA